MHCHPADPVVGMQSTIFQSAFKLGICKNKLNFQMGYLSQLVVCKTWFLLYYPQVLKVVLFFQFTRLQQPHVRSRRGPAGAATAAWSVQSDRPSAIPRALGGVLHRVQQVRDGHLRVHELHDGATLGSHRTINRYVLVLLSYHSHIYLISRRLSQI